MTRIESKKVEVNNSQENIFNFLTDFNNFEKLMPEGKISQWTSTSNECSFNINGMASIGMKIIEKSPFSSIKIVSHGKNPFEFILNVDIEAITPDQSVAQLIFEADINPFLKMMVEKPLTNFFNMLADKLKEISNQGLK